MLSLTFPWILLLLSLVAVALLFSKRRKFSLLILLFAVVLNWWSECIPLRLASFNGKTSGKSLKIMSFNIDGSSQDIAIRAHGIVNIINNQSPDLVFIAEYPESDLKSIDTLLNKIFPYSYYSGGYAHYFYSKFPLGIQYRLNGDSSSVGIYKSSVYLSNDTIILYGCHFASNNYTIDKKYITPDSIDSRDGLLTYIKDIDIAGNRRFTEATLLVNDMRNRHYPTVVMGDLNDVGGSKTIRLLENVGLNDAWWEGGVGYGATIHRPLPYRIDHILYTPDLQLNKIKVVSSEKLSDHDGLYAEFCLE